MITLLEAHKAGLLARSQWLPNIVAGVIVGVVAITTGNGICGCFRRHFPFMDITGIILPKPDGSTRCWLTHTCWIVRRGCGFASGLIGVRRRTTGGDLLVQPRRVARCHLGSRPFFQHVIGHILQSAHVLD